MLRPLLSIAPTVLLALAAVAPASADDKAKESLEGGYTIVSGEKYGTPIPEDEVKGATVRIAENGIIVTDKDKKDVYATAYVLDPAASADGPIKITLTSKLAPSEGKVAKGLIEKKGDTVRLIYALEGGEAPTEFKTKEKQLMFVMKNTKK